MSANHPGCGYTNQPCPHDYPRDCRGPMTEPEFFALLDGLGRTATPSHAPACSTNTGGAYTGKPLACNCGGAK